MASVSAKEIKNRIRSMESTKQITRAMEMVAASKLRHAQARISQSRPYFETLYASVNEIASISSDLSSLYFVQGETKRSLYIVLAGDRGLAGGYNSNILKLAASDMEGKNAGILPVGKKASDYFKAHNAQILTDVSVEAADLSVGDCFTIAKQLCKAYAHGQYGEIIIGYTHFFSVLSQVPTLLKVLPLVREPSKRSGMSDILYEPSLSEVLDAIVPEYVAGMLYGALCESLASEQASRRAAMDSATRNAHGLIDELRLKFNQARQSAITQEITEIIAGS